MNRINSRLATLGFILVVTMTGCDSPSQKVENASSDVIDANQKLDVAKAEYLAEVEAYKRETEAKITANEKLIMDFAIVLETEKQVVKNAYAIKVADLEKRNNDLKMKLEEYKENGKENWEQFKAEFNHDMDELGKAFSDLTTNNVKK